MAGQLMLVNPKRKRRRMTAKQAKYFGKRRRRRTTAVSAARNPTRRRRSRRRSRVTVRARRNPTAATIRRARRSGRARSRSMLAGLVPGNLIKGTLMPAAIGGGGALLVDLAWGFAPIPAQIKTGPLAPIAKIAGAIVVGAVAGKVLGKDVGQKVTAGYITVLAYNFAKSTVQKFAPALPLGDYDMGYISPAVTMNDPSIGAYIDGPGVGSPSSVGSYVSGYQNPFDQ